MNVKTRILSGFLGIVALIYWATIYYPMYLDILFLQSMTSTPLLKMFNITLVCWLIFVVVAFIGKRRILMFFSVGMVVLCVTTAGIMLYAANKFLRNLGEFSSAVIGNSVGEYKVAFEPVMMFIPAIILGLICLLISLKFGKKTIVKKEIESGE